MLYFHIHVFIFTFMLYFHIHGYVMHGFVYSYSWFIFTVRENLHASLHIHIHSPKSILCFNNSRQCILVWSYCLDQPRVHLKFPDGVMPSITSTICHNFALSNQRISWRSGMSFADGQRSPSANIFMICNFFCCSIFLNFVCQYSYQASNKKKITCHFNSCIYTEKISDDYKSSKT